MCHFVETQIYSYFETQSQCSSDIPQTLNMDKTLISNSSSAKCWYSNIFSPRVEKKRSQTDLHATLTQRELNRWSQFSEQKLRFFSKVKILKNAFNKK